MLDSEWTVAENILCGNSKGEMDKGVEVKGLGVRSEVHSTSRVRVGSDVHRVEYHGKGCQRIR